MDIAAYRVLTYMRVYYNMAREWSRSASRRRQRPAGIRSHLGGKKIILLSNRIGTNKNALR